MCSNIQPWAWLVEREERGKTIDSRTIPHLVKRVLDFGAHWRMFFLQEQMIKSGTLSPHQTVWKSAKTMSYSNFSAKNNFYWKSQFEYKSKAFVLWNFIFQWKTNNLEKMLLACEAIMNNRLFWKLAWWYSIMVLRKDRRERRFLSSKKIASFRVKVWNFVMRVRRREPPFKNAYFCK